MENRYKFIGPPGVGKTTTLSGSAKLNAANYGAAAIVCCSLTRAAAAVLAERVEAIPPKNIGTLHSLALRAIGSGNASLTVGKEKDFNQHNAAFTLSAGMGGSVDAPADVVYGGKTSGDRAREWMDILRARRTPRNHVDWSWYNCAAFAEAWDTWKRDAELMDFTDLLEICLRDVDACPGNPSVIIVDEAQDIPQLGIDLLLKWGDNASKIIFAGDANQNLYSWCGADASAFISIVTDPAHRKVISQSYRVPRAVHKLALRIEGWLTEREESPWSARDFEGDVFRSQDTIKSVYGTLERAAKLADAGQTVMILAPCGDMLDGIVGLMKRAGLPFHNSYRTWRADWNPIQRAPAKGKVSTFDRLMAFLKPCQDAWNDEAGRWTRHDLALWLEMVEAKSVFVHGGKKALTSMKGDHSPASFDDFAALLSTPGMEALDQWELGVGADIKPVFVTLRECLLPEWRKKLDYLMRVAEKRGVATLRETPKVVVGTVHSVKGGQAQHVFLFPELSSAGYREFGRGPKERDAIWRMFYVGATRASETLTICGWKWKGVSL